MNALQQWLLGTAFLDGQPDACAAADGSCSWPDTWTAFGNKYIQNRLKSHGTSKRANITVAVSHCAMSAAVVAPRVVPVRLALPLPTLPSTE